MYVPDLELHEASTLHEATDLLARFAPDARLLAGGTDLLVDLKVGRISVGHLVSIDQVQELHGITETEAGLRLGALTTITQLDRSPIVRARFDPLLDATGQMAARQIRNVATVGGNVVSAVPCADLPPILTVMSASAVIWSPAGERTVPLESFFVGVRQTVLRGDEILTAILVPPQPDGFGAAYSRFALRDGNTIAVAGAAASLRVDANDVVQSARIALGAVSPTPKSVESAGKLLVGRQADQAAFERVGQAAAAAADPISDVRGSAEFRREIVQVMTCRALVTALQRAKENRQ